MRLIPKQLPVNHNIFHFGDVHYGSTLSSPSGWNELVNLMHSEYDGCSNNYGVDGGDMIEAIMIDDPRYNEDKLKEPFPQEQIEAAIEQREHIKGMLLTILIGNHERKLWRFGNLTKRACRSLGVEYGTNACKLSIVDKSGNLMYKIFEEHGSRNITSTADDPKRAKTNMELILKRQLRRKAGDCAVMIKHHTHKLLVGEPVYELYMTDDGKKVKQNYTSWGENESYIHPDARWYGNAGSLLRLYGDNDSESGYAEIFEYDPLPLGFLVLKVRNKKIQELVPHYLRLK